MSRTARNFLTVRTIFLITLTAAVLAGCASNSINKRRQENILTYRMLSPDFQAAVDSGKVREGMDTNAVYIAWGKPTEVLQGGSNGRETTTWTYRAPYAQKQNFVGTYEERGAYSVQTYVRAQVIFAGGLVQKWQTFPIPSN